MDEEIRLTLRLPVSVRDAIVARTAETNRSMNGEIVELLQQGLDSAKREQRLGHQLFDAVNQTVMARQELETERAEVKQALGEILRRLENLEK